MSLTNSSFVDLLVRHRLLEPRQVDELKAKLYDHSDPIALGKHLVGLGWLTQYQIECVLNGQVDGLFVENYRLLEPIGAGGMGHVFKALHVRLKRLAAVKMIHPQYLKTADDPEELIRRFEREAQTAAQLMHTNIVALFDYNVVDGVPFIAMEYVDGVDLDKLVKTNGPLPQPIACDYIYQAATGLQHAFEAGIVHRDIKPHNLLVSRTDEEPKVDGKQNGTAAPNRARRRGVVKILDLGLVRLQKPFHSSSGQSSLTGDGHFIGTPDYISPEQARDPRTVDIRGDLYALGCTYYYLLTGSAPFPNGTEVEKILAHQTENPIGIDKLRPNTPHEIISIVKRLMAKKPEDRYQTPAELIDALTTASMELWSNSAVSMAEINLDGMAKETAVVNDRETSLLPKPDRIAVGIDNHLTPARRKALLRGHKTYVTSVTFSPDGNWLASGDLGGTIRLWDVSTSEVTELALQENTGVGEIGQVFFGRKGRVLCANIGGMENKLWLWDLSSSTPYKRADSCSVKYMTSCHVISPNGTTMAAGTGGAVLLYDLKTRRKRNVLCGHQGEVRALAYSPDGERLYTAADDKSIIHWEPGRMWSKQRYTWNGHESSVVSLAVSNSGKWIASGSLDRTIRIWNTRGRPQPTVTLTGHPNGVRAVRFVGKSGHLLSVCERGTIFLWDVEAKSTIRRWQPEKSLVHSIAISPDGRHVATGLNDGQVALYDLEMAVDAEKSMLSHAGVG